MTSRRALLGLLAAGGLSQAAPAAAAAPTRTLVVVFQRFAADWINMLVPYGDPDYARLRPNLKVTNSLRLDGFFGLHPDEQ